MPFLIVNKTWRKGCYKLPGESETIKYLEPKGWTHENVKPEFSSFELSVKEIENKGN